MEGKKERFFTGAEAAETVVNLAEGGFLWSDTRSLCFEKY